MTERDIALQKFLENPCVATRNALVTHHHGLVYLVVRKRLRLPPNLHVDAFQEGMLGLFYAIDKYDPSQGSFPYYALLWIRAFIQKWMEGEIRETRCTTVKRTDRLRGQQGASSRRVSNHVKGEGGEPLTEMVEDGTPGPQESVATMIARRKIRAALSRFSMNEREAAIIKEHVIDDIPLHILADRFGVTKQRMSTIKTNLLRRMEGAFEL